MRAVVYDRYGGPEVLSIAEVPAPSPGPKQVLVQVARDVDQPLRLGDTAGDAAVFTHRRAPGT